MPRERSKAMSHSTRRMCRSWSCVVRYRRGCAHHRIGGILGLGEGHHLTDVGLAGQEHHQAVDARGDAAVGRRAIFKSLQHVTKLLLGHPPRPGR